MKLLKRQSTDTVQPDDGALMEAYSAAVADATAKADASQAEIVVCGEVQQAAIDRVIDAHAKKNKTHYESFLANAVLSRLEQQVRSSDAVDPLVREGGPVITDLCTASAHIRQHVPLKLEQNREELRDLQKRGFKPGMTLPSGVGLPGSIHVALLEREIPLANWAEKHRPAFVSALEAVRALQLLRGVDFAAAVTAILKTLPQRCCCGHDFKLTQLVNAEHGSTEKVVA